MGLQYDTLYSSLRLYVECFCLFILLIINSMTKLWKLLEFLDNWWSWIMIYHWYSLPRKEIEYYLKKNIELKYMIDIRDFVNKFDYIYSYHKENIINEYKNIDNIIKSNNLNPDYYWFSSLENMIANIYKKPQKDIKPKKICKWYIYFIKDNNWYVKIWKTIDIKSRSKKYITENANKIDFIHSIYYDSIDYWEAEWIRHKYFYNKHHNRERFKLHQIDIDYIKSFEKNWIPNL